MASLGHQKAKKAGDISGIAKHAKEVMMHTKKFMVLYELFIPSDYIFFSQPKLIQLLKKLSQCLAVLQRLMQHKSNKLHNILKIIYVIL